MADAPRVAVVGAGLSGLAAAERLAAAGAAVTIHESEPFVGGRCRTDALEGFRVDPGAQLFASMFTRLFALAERAGLGPRLVRSPGRDALWRGGRAHEVTYGSVGSMLASGGLPLRTKLRLGTTYLPFLNRHAADLELHAPERAAAAGLDGESIAAWGRRELDDEFVDLLVYPQLAAYYGALPEETSAGLYHILARYGLDVGLFALRGGTGLLPETLAARVAERGGELRLSTPVDRVAAGGGGVEVATAAGQERFDGAVLAVPAPTARAMLGEEADGLRRWLAEVRFRPALSVAILLDRPAGVDYFGLSFPRAESRTLSAVCVEENRGAGGVPGGRGLLVAYLRPDVAPSLLESPAREIVETLLPDVERALPRVRGAVTRAKVYRWPSGSPTFHPGYLRHLGEFRRDGAGEGALPLALAGDYLYSASAEGAVTAGERAAARLLARLRPGAAPPV